MSARPSGSAGRHRAALKVPNVPFNATIFVTLSERDDRGTMAPMFTNVHSDGDVSREVAILGSAGVETMCPTVV